MVVTAGGDGGADENRVDKQCGGNLLQPQPGMADGPRDDVGGYGHREGEAQHSADDHQDQFETVQRPPFQVMLSAQYQFVGNHYPRSAKVRVSELRAIRCTNGRSALGTPTVRVLLAQREEPKARHKTGQHDAVDWRTLS